MLLKSHIALLALIIAGVLSCSSKPDYGSNSRYHSTRFPQTRTISQAQVWLHWSESDRTAFVRGLVVGYRQGNHDACNTGDGRVAPSACEQRTERLPPSVSALITDDAVHEYSKEMTKFYENYPEDDDVPITVLFQWLVFERKSPAEIHQLLTPRN